MARNKKVEILSNDKEVLHPVTDGDCVIFSDGQTLTQKLSEDDSVKYTPEVTNSSPMFKVGEGNTVDYSDNVLDGAYERATLQGQTYVNNIQEPSADTVTLPTPFTDYERTQHNTLTSDTEGTLGINLVGQSYVNALQHDSEESYVVLGESLEFQNKKVEYTKAGQIKSAILKGQTLVNLNSSSVNNLPVVSMSSNTQYTLIYQAKNGIEILIDEDNVSNWGYFSIPIKTELIKPSTKYFLKGNFKNVTQVRLCTGDGTVVWSNFGYLNGQNYLTFTTLDTLPEVPSNNRMVLFLNLSRKTGNECFAFDMTFIEYQEGMENWDIPYFEGIQSVTVSTKLENICQYWNQENPKTGLKFTPSDYNSRALSIMTSSVASQHFKPNTKYLVQFNVSGLVLDGLSNIEINLSDGTMAEGNCLFGETNAQQRIYVDSNGLYRKIVTTTDLVSTSSVAIKGSGSQWENSGSSLRSLTISNVMYIEYQNGMENWDLPYFEDYQVMKPVQVESVSKNIFTTQNVKGTYATSYTIHDNNSMTVTGLNDSITYKSVQFSIDVKPNTDYKISYEHEKISGSSSPSCDVYGIPKNGEPKKYLGTTTINSEIYDQLEIRFFINMTDASQNGTIKYYNIQMEESSTATSYVPHQSKTTYSWDEVILRKIGDVEDTLDLTTGEWVQRIGEIVLDGSDDEIWYPSGLNQDLINAGRKNIVFYYNQQNNGTLSNLKISPYDSMGNIICDKLKSEIHATQLIANTTHDYPSITGGTTAVELRIAIPVENSTAQQDSATCKAWLKANPIKVQYELAKPIVHKVNLSRPNLQVYDDITHVHTKCLDGTLIPNIYLPSDISYPAMLEPNTTYNVCVNHEVSSSNPLKVNVGGKEATMTSNRITITTPGTLTTDTVSFTGKDNVISETMLIKNSSLLTRDLPHFNGIESVRLGRTVENLCESRISSIGNATMPTWNFFDDHIELTTTSTGSRVIASKLLKPLKDGKKYFVYAPNNYPTNVIFAFSFSEYFNNGASFTRDMVETKGSNKYAIIEPNQKNILYREVVVGNHGSLPAGTYTIKYPIICEYVQGMENWDWESIGYFTGTKHIGNEFMKVQNKNLFDGIIERGSIAVDTGIPHVNDKEVRTKNFIKVRPGSTITISRSLATTTTACRWYDKDKNYLGIVQGNVVQPKTSDTCVVPANAHYLKLKDMSLDANGLGDLSQTFQIEESSTATTYTTNKHNELYIAPNEPIALTWEQGQVLIVNFGDSYTSAINNNLSNRVRNKGLLTLKPNTTYRISSGSKENFKYHIACFDKNGNAVHAITGVHNTWTTNVDTIFTTTKDMYKIGINIARVDDSAIIPSDINHIRLEELTEIQLRSCSSKYDELDITRGVYTQRVGMVYVDGTNINSNYITKVSDAYQPADTTLNTYDIPCDGAILSARCLCNRFPVRDSMNSTEIKTESVCIHSSNASCRLVIKKSKASTLEEFKLWLQDNPLTILYPLKNPIEHKVIIGNKNESNTEVVKPNGVFTLPTLYTEQTHIDLQNEGLMPQVQSRNYIAYPIIPMVSRTYTLQHNNVGSNDLTIDLCGRTQTLPYSNHKGTVYTPETMDGMLHKEVRISGANNKINHVMLIDGGYMDREVPYFEGMKNACNPVVKNIGENLISQHNANIKNNHHIKIGRLTYDEASFSFIGGQDYCDIQFYVYLVTGKTYRFRADGNFYALISILEDMQDGYKQTKEIQKIENSRSFVYIGKTGWQTLHIAAIQSLSNIQLVEGDVLDSQAERYKENICYVDCGEIRLTQDMFEQGSVGASSVGSHYDSDKTGSQYRVRTQKLIELEIGEQYVFLGDNNYLYSARFYDINGNKVSHSGTYDLSWKGNIPFTILNDAPMCAFFIARVDGKAITPSDVSTINFHLVKISEIRQLRSLPNGVHDEIDLETGKYIQRVGEITFSGTDEVWKPGYASWENQRTFYNNRFVDIKLMKGDSGSGQAYYDAVRCPQLHRSYMSRLASALIDGVCSYYYSGYQRIFISKQDCETPEQLIEWLKENPITVQYELPEPIVKDIVIHNYPHSYEGGHVIIENNDPSTPIPAQIVYRAVTNRSGQIQQHTEQIGKQEKEINELETLILENIRLSQTRS